MYDFVQFVVGLQQSLWSKTCSRLAYYVNRFAYDPFCQRLFRRCNQYKYFVLPLPYKIGTKSVAKRVLVFIPTNSGDPRRVATHSPG